MSVSFPDEKASAYIQSTCLQEDLSILIEPVAPICPFLPFFCQYDVFVWAHELRRSVVGKHVTIPRIRSELDTRGTYLAVIEP
jgi:hypothetical protein